MSRASAVLMAVLYDRPSMASYSGRSRRSSMLMLSRRRNQDEVDRWISSNVAGLRSNLPSPQPPQKWVCAPRAKASKNKGETAAAAQYSTALHHPTRVVYILTQFACAWRRPGATRGFRCNGFRRRVQAAAAAERVHGVRRGRSASAVLAVRAAGGAEQAGRQRAWERRGGGGPLGHTRLHAWVHTWIVQVLQQARLARLRVRQGGGLQAGGRQRGFHYLPGPWVCHLSPPDLFLLDSPLRKVPPSVGYFLSGQASSSSSKGLPTGVDTEALLLWGVGTGHSQGNLPAVFRNGGLELLRPGLAKESGYIECFPKASWKKPYLLEQLELFLEQKVRARLLITHS